MHRIATCGLSLCGFRWAEVHLTCSSIFTKQLSAYDDSSYVCDSAWILDQKKVRREGNMLALSTPKTWGGYRWDPASNISAVSSSQDSILYKSDSINIPHWSTLQYSFHKMRWVWMDWLRNRINTTWEPFSPLCTNQTKVSLIIGIAIFPARLWGWGSAVQPPFLFTTNSSNIQ